MHQAVDHVTRFGAAFGRAATILAALAQALRHRVVRRPAPIQALAALLPRCRGAASRAGAEARLGAPAALAIHLARGLVPRLVTIVARLDHHLLLERRVTIARVLSLVHRRRGGRRGATHVPPVPTVTALGPLRSPIFLPARRRIDAPAAERDRGAAVI